MTTPVRDSLVLRSPDALVASLPHLLGFWPRDSVVAVWIGDGRVRLTQRLDLASWSVDPDGFLSAMWDHPSARDAAEVIFVLVTSIEPPSEVIDMLREKATEQDVMLRDFLIAGDGTWRSALCRDDSCCPRLGRQLDAATVAEVNAEFAVLGSAPLADRAAVVDSAQRDHVAAARVAQIMQPLKETTDVAIDMVLRCTLDASTSARTSPLDEVNAAAVLVALSDIRVRDTVLWELCRVDALALQRVLAVLWRMLRLAPDGFVAPVATTCAIVSWLLGDGVRANVAVERALAAEPSYTLGQLIAHALRGGLPPGVWRDAMTSVTRDQCRYGLRASASASS